MAPTDYSVTVREYRRVREGNIEKVRQHRRRPRRWYRRPLSMPSAF
jgi:hypothetical protein